MQRAPRVTLAYQTSECDRYVGLIGRARMIDDRTEMRSLWSGDWDRLFPSGFADAHMMVATVEVDRIEIHARGVTTEPFGHGRTWIERTGAHGGWCRTDYRLSLRGEKRRSNLVRNEPLFVTHGIASSPRP
ncbi:MAG TPA: pyridoxamine 5'-phosphate oxidase family protein [Acetobacteraceae bacterium]